MSQLGEELTEALREALDHVKGLRDGHTRSVHLWRKNPVLTVKERLEERGREVSVEPPGQRNWWVLESGEWQVTWQAGGPLTLDPPFEEEYESKDFDDVDEVADRILKGTMPCW